jgi:hypothetical protein
MRKFIIFVMLALLLCFTATAQALTTINSTGDPSYSNSSLWEIINSWTSAGFVNQTALQSATTLSTIPAGSYIIVDWAGYAGFGQEFGEFDATGSVPAKGSDFIVSVTGGFNSNVKGTSFPFSQTKAIAFFDYADGYSYAITTNGSSTNGKALIFDFTSSGYGYVIAFEDGNNNGLGDQDYNDFVARVIPSAVPIPGGLLLLGCGFVRLWGLRRKIVT